MNPLSIDELITLNLVSIFPFGKVYARKWVNVYIKQSLLDKTVGKIPVVGNIANSVLTLPSLFTKKGKSGGYIANIGRQLGRERGAHNVMLNVSHANAQAMYTKARQEIFNAPINPKAIGRR